MTSPVKIGDVIDNKYKVEGILGEGGMGVVVAALHLELDLRVALKFLLPEAFSNLEAVQRFVREARAAAKIRSEHVARILDTGRLEDGSPFQVMELLDGEDLSKVLATRGAVAVEDAVSYVLQASEALAEAHAAGIVHRDLKPANLFLARKPDRTTILKVLDFGISKNLASTEKGLTRSNAIVGSPFYMSPEQLTYGREVDARSDIWSLGIILYELLSGTPPFGGETLPQVVAGILLNKPRTVGELRPGLPPALNAAIGRCMMTEPGDRYASVAELAHALVPYGPHSARESAERISRVLHHSYAPGALAPTMADPLPNSGSGAPSITGSGAAAARSHGGGGLSGTAAPWSRTGNGQAHSLAGGHSGKSAVFLAIGTGLLTVAIVVTVGVFGLRYATRPAAGGAASADVGPPESALAVTTASGATSASSAVIAAPPPTGVPTLVAPTSVDAGSGPGTNAQTPGDGSHSSPPPANHASQESNRRRAPDNVGTVSTTSKETLPP
jgi:serine/threonine-protein kinase